MTPNLTSTLHAPSPLNLNMSTVCLFIFSYQDPQIEDATQTISKAFVEYNTSVNAHPEMIAGDFGDARTASMVVSWSVSSRK